MTNDSANFLPSENRSVIDRAGNISSLGSGNTAQVITNMPISHRTRVAAIPDLWCECKEDIYSLIREFVKENKLE